MHSGRIMHGNYILCEIDFDYNHVTAQGGSLAPSLRFRPRIVKMNQLREEVPTRVEYHYSVISLNGDVLLDYDRNSPENQLARFSLSQPIAQSWLQYEHRFEIDILLDCFRLKWLEDRRKDDLKIRIDGTATIAVHSNASGADEPGPLLRYEEASLEIRMIIPQSHWAGKLLPKLGRGEIVFMEIPVGSEPLHNAWTYLKKAERAFDKWEPESIAINCRSMVTSLTRSLSQKLGSEHPAYKYNWRRAAHREKKDKDFYAIPGHPEDLPLDEGYDVNDLRFQKADAEFALNYAKILMKYAQELYRRKEE